MFLFIQPCKHQENLLNHIVLCISQKNVNKILQLTNYFLTYSGATYYTSAK